ncbi:MAG: S8 family serine peptidase [Chloroflexota bacterium]
MKNATVIWLQRSRRAAVALSLAVAALGLLWMLVASSSRSMGPDANKPGRHPHLEAVLEELVTGLAGGDPSAARLAAQQGISLHAGRVQVVIQLAGQEAQTTIEATVAALGGAVEAASGPWIQAHLPPQALTTLADTPGVNFVRRPWRPLPLTVSQGVTVTLAQEWHTIGFGGQGVRVGVLDVGFFGYKNRIGEGELPGDVITRSFVGSGTQLDFWNGESHGTACAEVVHDMAPQAQLYLVNFDTEVTWAEAVDWLLARDVDIISFSAGWPLGGPGDGSGYLAEKVSQARDDGVLWVNAAGNSARQHWMGPWSDPDADSWHNFLEAKETNKITVAAELEIVVGLRWDDPWGESANDYDLFLFDSALKQVAESDNIQNGESDPLEIIVFNAPATGIYHVAITKQPGAQVRTLELFSYDHDFYYQTVTSSLIVPADSPGALTVGATYWQNDTLEGFSSQGPTRDGRAKPDLAAPDGVSVRTETYAAGFYGTSASAPHVAGGAALMLDAATFYTPTRLQDWLEAWAKDLGPAGHDTAYGAGRLDLTPRLSALTPPAALRDSHIVVNIAGAPFSPTATFFLSRPGEPILAPGGVTHLSATQLSGTLNLSGAASGYWTAVVSQSGGVSIVLSDAFFVASDQVHLPLVLKHLTP